MHVYFSTHAVLPLVRSLRIETVSNGPLPREPRRASSVESPCRDLCPYRPRLCGRGWWAELPAPGLCIRFGGMPFRQPPGCAFAPSGTTPSAPRVGQGRSTPGTLGGTSIGRTADGPAASVPPRKPRSLRCRGKPANRSGRPGCAVRPGSLDFDSIRPRPVRTRRTRGQPKQPHASDWATSSA